jgi:nucleoside-diphosphate-sugar epimerase
MKALVTGATGFVGRAIIDSLSNIDVSVIAAVRQSSDIFSDVIQQVEIGELAELAASSSVVTLTSIEKALQNVDLVIHTAARVHMMQDSSANPLEEFRKVNRDATLTLAHLSAVAGVKRFIFLSSIKVNGEMTKLNHAFTTDDFFVPTDPYGLSKYEAEQGLLALSKEMNMEVVIIRPPLVYGPGVRANFLSMIKWINMGVPLPFGAVHNKRSLLALENLVSFIIHCADVEKTPQAANQIFLLSDGEDVSTTELLRKVAKSLGKRPLLIPVPMWLMAFAAKLINKSAVANRLFSSLQVDSSKSRVLLDWKPVVTMDEQLNKMVKH